jgi:hypothetical protein
MMGRRKVIMKMCEFEGLQEAEQLSIIQENGVYIGKRWKKNISILLYQLEDFYIEVVYRKYRCYIANIRCFRSTLPLEPYLPQVDIGELGLMIV